MSVCLSARISPKPHARSLPFLVHVDCVRGSVLLRHVYDRPHRLSPGRVFFPIENALSAGKGGWESTARAKYGMYDCLVEIEHFRTLSTSPSALLLLLN